MFIVTFSLAHLKFILPFLNNIDIYTFKKLSPKDLIDMYATFGEAFSDYPIPFKLTKAQFIHRFVQKLNLNFSCSTGVYYEKKLVGFILNTIEEFRNKLTAYNGGTGVIKNYRGQRLTSKMYEHLIPALKANNVKHCVLEALVQNKRAIEAYHFAGFEICRELKCFRLESDMFSMTPSGTKFKIMEVREPDWKKYAYYKFMEPSFLDSNRILEKKLAGERFFEGFIHDECVAHVVFQCDFGRINQLGIHPEYMDLHIGEALVNHLLKINTTRSVNILNIDASHTGYISFLENIGFKKQFAQYEMRLTL